MGNVNRVAGNGNGLAARRGGMSPGMILLILAVTAGFVLLLVWMTGGFKKKEDDPCDKDMGMPSGCPCGGKGGRCASGRCVDGKCA